VGSSGIKCERQNQTEVVLGPGQYLIVPVTTGCKFEQELAVDMSTIQLPSLFKGEEGGEFSEQITAAFKEIFYRLDMDLDGLLSKEELDNFMELTEGYDMPEEVYEWIVENFDCKDGALTEDGFIQIYTYLWQSGGRDPELIWRDLQYMGYDRALRRVRARSALIAIHADKQFDLFAQAFDPEAYEEALELPVKKWGKASAIEDGKAKLYVYRAGSTGATVAVENMTPNKTLSITIDCVDGSHNIQSHRGSLTASQDVPPKETKILHQLMPLSTFDEWSWSYKITSVRWSSAS